jgi:hypothetical protein
MQGVYDFIEKKIDTNQLYINKNKLIDNVYKINEIREDLTVGDDLNELDFQKLANSASVLEIIRKQTERYNFFYISHAYDSRMRIYAQS